ncbi:cutinase family protein [Cutibacterium equinum]|uniref:Cutinase family protein n=1 Tax=Cutibacterium equinum TaxID=3016342 RepID=A0ABY7R2G0_9ACTN|nr:cutinase family protein [Cutibacterium equinum]WCC81185.1 cutinase family protein [Cutibacterium equinum]
MGWDSDPVSSQQASQMECASVMFVGVRGSGETPPYGTTITSIRDALAQKWKNKGTVRQVYLDYPAADPHTLQDASLSGLLFDATMPSTEYFDSAALGATKLTALLNAEKKQCPDEWVILAGFSQGSQAITQALASTDTPQRLAGAILAGNPDHYPGQNVQELSGDAGKSAIGTAAILYYLRERANATPGANRDDQMRAIIKATLGLSQESVDQEALEADMANAGAAIPPEAYAETYSVCMKGDPVCDTAPALTRILTLQSTWQDELNQGRPIHMGYTRTVLEAPLDRIAQRANAVGAAEAKGAPIPHGQTVTVTTREWGPWQIGVAVGAGVLGLALGWLLGRAGRRRHRGR